MLADINGNLADLRSEAAMASQRFCLRWNNHQSNLLSVFDQLLHDESFVDVTLAVEGQLLRAHKMVLSACSPYFQALFVNHPDKHPIVILKDVPYVDMRSLLDFMYRGEVSVDQDRLTAFLRVAESLRIKGLTEVHEDKSELPSITSSLLSGSGTGQSSGGVQPPPSLHRINQLSQQPLPQKRYHHMSSHPLLGSALTAPKRKRGRPRKLSGSSDTPMDANLSQEQCIDLVQGSPEMMEMKMGLDFQSEAGFNSSGASAASNGNNNNNNNNNSCRDAKDDEVTENGTDILDASLLVRIKGEPEPTPSTSHAKEEEFTRPLSRQGSDSFKQGALHRPSCVSRLPSDTTFEICNVLTGQQHQLQNNDGPSEDSEVWTGLNADHQDTVLGDMSPNSDQLGVNERNQTLNKLVNKAYDRSHIHQASGVNLDESAVHQHQTSQSTNANSIVDTTGAIPQSASRSGLIMRSTDGDSSRIISGNTCGSIESNNKKCSSPGLITSQSCLSHQGIPTSTTRIQNQLSQCHEIRHQALRVEARPVRLRGCGCKRTVLARLAPTLCCYRTTLSSTTTAVYRPKSLLTALRPRI